MCIFLSFMKSRKWKIEYDVKIVFAESRLSSNLPWIWDRTMFLHEDEMRAGQAERRFNKWWLQGSCCEHIKGHLTLCQFYSWRSKTFQPEHCSMFNQAVILSFEANQCDCWWSLQKNVWWWCGLRLFAAKINEQLQRKHLSIIFV